MSSIGQVVPVTNGAIHGLWLLAALASYLIWGGFVVTLWLGSVAGSTDLGFALGALGLAGLIASGATAYLVYALIERYNKHSARVELFFWNSLERLESGSAGSNVMIPLSSAQESVTRLARTERQKSGMLWALLSMVPLLGWVFLMMILWLLSRSFTTHARLEGPALEDVDRTLRASGSQGIIGGSILIRSRDTRGYIVMIALLVETFSALLIGISGYLALAYFTIGAFSLFWLDLSIWDPLTHFHNYSKLETDLIRSTPESMSKSRGST